MIFTRRFGALRARRAPHPARELPATPVDIQTLQSAPEAPRYETPGREDDREPVSA
jgi:hypothetical protein